MRGGDFVGLTQLPESQLIFESFLGRVVYFGFYINLDSSILFLIAYYIEIEYRGVSRSAAAHAHHHQDIAPEPCDHINTVC